MRSRWPLSDVVATVFHTVDHHFPIAALREILLHRLINTVCVADQDREVLLENVVEPLPDLRIQPRHSARASNKNTCHCLTPSARERDCVNSLHLPLLFECLC